MLKINHLENGYGCIETDVLGWDWRKGKVASGIILKKHLTAFVILNLFRLIIAINCLNVVEISNHLSVDSNWE